MVTAGKPIASLRWWIGGLLFASTVINYIDRQTLSLLAPYPQDQVSVEQLGLREYCHRLPGGLFDRTDRLRETHGPHRHPPGSDPHGNLEFAGLDVDVHHCESVQRYGLFFHHGVVAHLPGCTGISRMDICIRAKRRDWESTMTRSWLESFHTSGRTCP
jgi:hypothetical protein